MDIQSTNINAILKKDSFRRPLPLPLDSTEKRGSSDYDSNMAYGRPKYFYPTQEDFLREFDPTSHAINSLKYYPNLLFFEGGSSKVQMKIRSRVAIAWQKRIHTKRLMALMGYEPDISIAKSNTDKKTQDILASFKEGWMKQNMDNTIWKAISSDLKTGDTAICCWLSEGRFGTRVFAYDKGDILYPHFDPQTGELELFGRKFTKAVTDEDGETYEITFLEVWDRQNYIQYRTSTEKEKSQGAKDWIVSRDLQPHNFSKCPICYHRYGEPCWAASQSSIEQHELAMSELAENNAQYALRILYTLGAEFEMEGTTDGTPRHITSTDPNAKVGYLEAADSSSSFDLQIKSLEKEIMRCSFAVESPEIKSGSDISSLTVKALMGDSYLKALDDSREYQDFLDSIVSMFIEGYGSIKGMKESFDNINVMIRLQPWTFMAESEIVNQIVQLVTIGVLSRQSATEYMYETLGLGSIDEAQRILQKAHDTLVTSQEGLEAQTNNPVNNARKLNAEING